MPIFDEFNVDLVLSAHLHSYRNRGHDVTLIEMLRDHYIF